MLVISFLVTKTHSECFEIYVRTWNSDMGFTLLLQLRLISNYY